jgi:putative oxidoreductase
MVYVFLLGRILFSLIFLVKSVEHFSHSMVMHARDMGVPLPEALVPIFGLLALIGGLSILLGYKAKIGAWLLVLFLIPVTFMMHPFWKASDFYSSMMHQYCFWKNLSLLGVTLMLAYAGSGPLSVDRCCKK